MKKKIAKSTVPPKFHRIVRCIEAYEQFKNFKEFDLSYCGDYIIWCKKFKKVDDKILDDLLDRITNLYEDPTIPCWYYWRNK